MSKNYNQKEFTISAEEFFDNCVLVPKNKGLREWFMPGIDLTGNAFRVNATIKFDPSVTPELEVVRAVVHDGSLVFGFELMQKILMEFMNLRRGAPDLPPVDHRDTVHYTVGDFRIIAETDGDFVPPDKPWMECRTEIHLPYRIEVEHPT